MSRRTLVSGRAGSGALALAVALALTGCSSETDGAAEQAPPPTESPTSSDRPAGPSEAGAPEASELRDTAQVSCEEALSAAALADLAGQPLDGPIATSVVGLPICRWESSGGVRVQVASVPAESWGRQLPALLDQVEAGRLSDDERWLGKLEAARQVLDAGVHGREACEIFGLLLEIQGEPRGSSRVAVFVPTSEDPLAVSAQTCTGDTYSSVQLVAPDLGGTREEARRVSAALDIVHTGGTAD